MNKTILIGNNLISTKDYQLKINHNNINIDRIMTEQEYQAVITIMQEAQYRKESVNRIVEKIDKYYNR